MKHIVLLATGTRLSYSIEVSAQQDDTWRMHDVMDWGWGGMWLGPLFMLAALALLVSIVVFLARWLGGDRGAASKAPRTARDLLDERYARGEINREEYLRRRQDLAD